jgi:hypothetical protein
MSRFTRHIKEYYFHRLGVQFLTRDFGFCGFRTIGDDFYIEELYVERGTSYTKSLRFFREIIEFAREVGCKRVIGGNEKSLDTYDSIKRLHTFYGAYYSGQSDGTKELWIKDL